MYAAEVKGQRLNFAVSGMLWKRSLVMRDDETDSLWSHILGKCMSGKLKDTQLIVIPSLMTDWKSWKESHPKTSVVVLSRTSRQFKNKVYSNTARYLVGLPGSKQSKAWRFDHLEKQPVVNDRWKNKPIVVNLSLSSFSSAIFSRELNGQELVFEIDDAKKIKDKQTGSTWNLQVGIATDGKLKGQRLKQLPSIPSFTRAWKNYHPNTGFWEPASSANKSSNEKD